MSVLSKFNKENLDDDVFVGLSPLQDAIARQSWMETRREKEKDKMAKYYENTPLTRENSRSPIMMTPDERRWFGPLAEENYEDSMMYNEPRQGFYYDPMTEQGTLMERFQQGLGNVSTDAYHAVNRGMNYIEPVMRPMSEGAGYIMRGLTIPYGYAREQIER